MEENDIKNNVIIIALSNLIDNYSYLLDKENEDPSNTLSEEDIEYIQFLIKIASCILVEMSSDTNKETLIDRPKWQNL